MTSPVLLISGPNVVETPGNLSKEKIGLFIATIPFFTGRDSGKESPSAILAASLASENLIHLLKNGTVLEALGLISRIYTLLSFSAH